MNVLCYIEAAKGHADTQAQLAQTLRGYIALLSSGVADILPLLEMPRAAQPHMWADVDSLFSETKAIARYLAQLPPNERQGWQLAQRQLNQILATLAPYCDPNVQQTGFAHAG